ncbi:MAG: exosortase A [Gammaproteobacteria bacterium]
MSGSSEDIGPTVSQMSGETGDTPAAGWRWPGIAAVLLIFAVLAVFWQTGQSMVSIWWRSETYAHGFLIGPIAVYLIWRQRHALAEIVPRPDWRGFALLLLLGLGWLVADVTDVLVIEQLCFVAMIPTVVWTVLGWRVVRAILFPLGFLFFAVPMGQALIPHLMNFTSEFVVKGLRITGIPVYQEGTFFAIPGMTWSVVEGCSGMRYLIASITMGFLYAYLSYRGMWRRLAFIALATVFPIIANGLRAYTIVLMGYWIDKRLALGVDHIIYGWVFFGFVMVLMFWIGTLWLEHDSTSDVDRRQGGGQAGRAVPRTATVVIYALGVLVTIGIWPVMGSYVNARHASLERVDVRLTAPPGGNGWRPDVHEITGWAPRYIGQDAQVRKVYEHDGRQVGLYVAYYARQRQGQELVNYQNVMVVQKDPVWRQVQDKTITVKIGGQPREIIQSRLRSSDQNLLVWHFYWLDGYLTSNDYVAKLIEAKRRLSGGNEDGAGIVVYTEYGDGFPNAERLLREYLNSMLGTIDHHLKEVATQ